MSTNGLLTNLTQASVRLIVAFPKLVLKRSGPAASGRALGPGGLAVWGWPAQAFAEKAISPLARGDSHPSAEPARPPDRQGRGFEDRGTLEGRAASPRCPAPAWVPGPAAVGPLKSTPQVLWVKGRGRKG